MSFFTGFAGEFGRQLGAQRKENADRAERSASLENAILQHLTTSTDPEIASRAVAGLLSQAGPGGRKAKGLRGFLGETEGHPALPMLRDFIMAGRPVEGGPSSAPTPAGTPGSAAMPATSVQTPGGPGIGSTPPPSAAAAASPVSPTATPGPRQVFRLPEQQAEITGHVEARSAAEKEAAVIKSRMDAYTNAPSAGARTVIPGVSNPPAPRAAGEWQDPTTGQWYRQEYTSDPDTGTPILRQTPISKVAPRPTGPEAQALERAQEIMAAQPAGAPPLPLEAALTQARAEQRTLVQTKADEEHQLRVARLQALIPATIARWQAVNGTTPMNRTQAIAAARQALGTAPEVTLEDVTRLADGLMATNQRPSWGPAPGATRPAPPLGSPGAPPPLRPAGAAPPGQTGGVGGGAPPAAPGAAGGAAGGPPASGSLTAAVPPDLAGVQRNYRAYSAQGKQTLMAVEAISPLLDQIEANIRAAGLTESGNPLPEMVQKKLYALGFAPDETVEQRLQLTGMAEAYGLRGLIVGRANLPLQQIMQMHLAQPGDSPKLILQKIATLRESLPVIRQAVDTAEGARVGSRGRPAGGGTGSATAAVPTQTSAVDPLADLADLAEGHKRTRANGEVWARVDGRLVKMPR
jgi:hypothetical protein